MMRILLFFSWITTGYSVIFAQYEAPLFTLMKPSETGVSFHNTLKEDEERNVLQYQYFYNGGGIAAGDINNDGLCDLFFCGNDVPNRLYLNRGNWQFEDISKKSGITAPGGWSTGAVMVDVNADGWLDIYVCRSGKLEEKNRRNLLWINQGNETFVEQAAAYGLDDPAYSTMAAFLDYDADGDLDMFLLNHSVTQYSNFNVAELRSSRDPLAGNKLYRNDQGIYTDVSAAAGIIGNPINFGLGVAITDFNNDGYPDIFCTNDYQEQDYLYLNLKDGRFAQVLEYATGHTSLFSMGADAGDVNNDGLSDLLVADMLPASNQRMKMLKGPLRYDAYQLGIEYGFHHQLMRNTLQLNNGNGTFSDIGLLAGVAQTDWSWAPLMTDLDNDGWVDIYVTNGYRRDFTNLDFLKFTYNEELNKATSAGKEVDMFELVQKMPSVKLHNYVFANNKDLTFSDKTTAWGIQHLSFSNGAVYADLNNDGYVDIVVNNINDTAFIYKNNGRSNGYLTLSFKGPEMNPFGVGCKVTLKGENLYQVKELFPTRGYQSAMENKLYFGLGNTYVVDVQVEWPGGKKQVFRNVRANQHLQISYKDKGITDDGLTPSVKPALFSAVEPGILPATYKNNNYIDFKREPLLTFSLSDPGPKIILGDVNGDGLEDILYTAAKGQKAILYHQLANGTFDTAAIQPFPDVLPHDMSDAAMADIDGDGDLDIWAVYGGNESFLDAGNYQPVLLINQGAGVYTPAPHQLPGLSISASCIRMADIDQDGDLDAFIGSACLPGKYPLAGSSYILKNQNGFFTDVTDSINPLLRNAGMVTDARWDDVNRDGYPDLLITGWWMPFRVFIQTEDGMEEVIQKDPLAAASGWYACLIPGDINNDGRTDYVLGNLGLNTPFRATSQHPLSLFAMDFDRNGTIDPILAAYEGDSCYPTAGRDDLLDQINVLKKRFVRYETYAKSTVQQLFPQMDLNQVMKLEINNLATVILVQQNDGQFIADTLPYMAQMFPVRTALFSDIDLDGKSDLVLAGNRLGVRPDVGRMDAGQGLVLLQAENEQWRSLPFLVSGLYTPGEVTDCKWLTLGSKSYVLFGAIGSPVFTYSLNSDQ